ncbi:TPA: diphthine--ammonia ligase [Candidatus Woesearchaeota archaeon]|nr:hypothetical protein QT06_C0001G0085 [archaeon GW2011_AR15]MBS3104108.1 diphthine--ammonia ligase [Candidatus Woesearchaeota archaeon]HIH41388.1 diphthine--ammonia ligase [Candidatus Woesearchaeota archaeon]
MRLAGLFSGGKDSAYAIYRAMQLHEIASLITIKSKNPESYMFHTPNTGITQLQAEAAGLPLIVAETEGKKEAELADLKEAVKKAVELFRIEGVVTGAIGSVYQAARIQKICDELGLWCFNPLWQLDQLQLLDDLLKNKFEVIIVGVAAYPFDESWLGKRLDRKAVKELAGLKEKYKINPAGEGGEFESFVLSAPFFRKKINVKKSSARFSGNHGVFEIKEAELE